MTDCDPRFSRLTKVPAPRRTAQLCALFACLLGVTIVPLPAVSPSPSDSQDAPGASLTLVRGLIDDGRFMQAKKAAQTLLASKEATAGSESLEVAEVLDLLVEARSGEEDLDEEALAQARRALAIKEKLLPDVDRRLAVSIDNLAQVLIVRESMAEARPICERGVALAEKAFGPDHPALAKSLTTLADWLYQANADMTGSGKLYERALAIFEKALGPGHPKVARTLKGLAGTKWHSGDLQAGLADLERALAIQEKALRAEHPDIADTLQSLSFVRWNIGDKSESYRLQRRAADIAEHSLGPDSPRLATFLHYLAGDEAFIKGDFVEADRLLARALAIRERFYGKESGWVADSLGTLGAIKKRLGDYAEAERLLAKDLELLERIYGPEYEMVGTVLRDLGSLHAATGDYSGSSGFFTRSLAILEKARGAESTEVATVLVYLGQNSHALGDYAGAEALYRQALQIYEKRAPESDNVGWAQINIADALRDQGRFAEANPMYERALAFRERIWGPENPLIAWNTAHYAEALIRSQQTRKGFDEALRAEEIARRNLQVTARGLPERQALGYAAVRDSGLDLAISVAVSESEGSLAARAWDALIRSRALILDEIAGRVRAATGSGDAGVSSAYSSLSAARQKLADLTIRGPDKDSPERYRALLDDARGEKERAERALAEKSHGFGAGDARDLAGLDDVRPALPPGSALVAFGRYLEHDIGNARKNAGAAGSPTQGTRGEDDVIPHYAAFILVAGGGDVRVIGLGPTAEIDSLVNRWQHEVALPDGGERSPTEMEAAERAAGSALRRRIWDPVASLLGRPERVLVVPDGALHLVNLNALPAEGGRYLVEIGPLIQYLSAERDLLPGRSPVGARKGLLALGGAAFDDARVRVASQSGAGGSQEVASVLPAAVRARRSACGDFQSMRFEPLPDSGREANEIVALWKRDHQGDREGRSLTGADASESAFKTLAPGHRVIHLATHGFFLGGRCTSALDAAGGPSGPVGDRASPPPAIGENPLLLSGLVLAGANRRAFAGPGEEDGILTAEEIAALDLSGVDWVVLSACDTGIGAYKAGEGIFGLQRAFQIAGARTVISSLWSVEDDATRAWMRELYKARLDGAPAAAAVRNASRKMIDSLKRSGLPPRPYFWGSFIAVGG